MSDLTNSFEGIAPGTAVSAANSGGTSGSALDSVSIGTGATCAADNAQAAHGSVSCKMATGGTAAAVTMTWSASLGTQTQVWFRVYLFLTANPQAALRLVWTQGGGTRCANLQITTAGKIQFLNSSGTSIFTSTAAVPLNAWCRIEGFIIGSATAGQVEAKLFTTMDGTTAAETDTSSAVQNTHGSIDTIIFGPNNTNAAVGPFWVDDVGASAVAYLGPAVTQLSGADTAAAADTATMSAAAAGTDTATGADSAALSASLAAADTGPAADTAALAATAAAADSGSAADTAILAAGLAGADTATGAGAAALAALIATADAAATASLASLAAQAAAADTATAADTASVSVLAPPIEDPRFAGALLYQTTLTGTGRPGAYGGAGGPARAYAGSLL